MSQDNPKLPAEKTPLVIDYLQLLLENAYLSQQIDAQNYVLKALSDVFVEHGVAAGANTPAECMQSLRNRLSDVAALYAVMRGEQKASGLLADMERFIPAEVFTAIVVDLSTFLAPRLQKFVEQLQDAGHENKAAIAAAMLVTGMKGWEDHRPVFEHRALTVQQIQRKLQELYASAGITDEKERQLIEHEISAAIGGDVLALSQVEAGDFSGVETLFAERMKRQRIQ